MKGFFSAAVKDDDYLRGESSGKSDGSPFQFTLTVASDDVQKMVSDSQHPAKMTGTALHLVDSIEPVDGGYKVFYDRITGGTRIAGSQTARLVIVAAGSLGSTELLLRCRDVHESLPDVSPFLGHDWSSNGDFLTPAFYNHRALNPSIGPTIACIIDFRMAARTATNSGSRMADSRTCWPTS
jgi:hypothetical protein